MTPTEEDLLQQIGVILLGNLAGFTSMTLVYGVFVLLFAICTYKIANRDIKSHWNLVMFLTSFITFTISTIYWSAYLATFATLVRGILVDTDIGPLDTGGSFEGIDKKNLRFAMMQNWTAQLLPMISDAVVVWRAWELCSDIRWIMTFPVALLIGAIGSGLGFLGVVSSENINLVGSQGGSPDRRHMLISFLSLSLATNAISTLLIIFKLRARERTAMDISKLRVVIIFLLESGVLYAATQIINLVLELIRPSPDTSLFFGEKVVNSVYTLSTAMYPTIAILFVTVQRSLSHIYGFTPVYKKPSSKGGSGPSGPHGGGAGGGGFSAGARPATVGHLSFAARGTQANTTFTSESQLGSVSVVLDSVSEKEKVGTIGGDVGDDVDVDSNHGRIRRSGDGDRDGDNEKADESLQTKTNLSQLIRQ